MKRINLITALIAGLAASGCATMFSGTTQNVQINTTLNGQPLTGTSCTVQNNRGSWMSNAPDNVMVKRDGNPLAINCTSKDNAYFGTATVEPYYNTTNLWNIGLTLAWIVPGVVGWVWDGVDGTTNEYPHTINITMMQKASESQAIINSKPQESASITKKTV